MCNSSYKTACLAAALLAAGGTAAAAPVASVDVSVSSTEGEIPASVAQRIRASISSIGSRVLVGKEERIFQLNRESYDRVLADIVNRVVVGYVVAGIDADYGEATSIHVSLAPVGRMIESVETEIDYGNLSPEAARLVEKDLAGAGEKMSALLTGLPVDSVGWAESVSESAGRDLLAASLPEFQASFEVEPSEHTKVRIYLIPQGTIVRRGELTFRETTIPRVFMYYAAENAERTLRGLEGLPVDFVRRHGQEIAEDVKEQLLGDAFIKKYEIDIRTELLAGEKTELKVDALTDHWIIKTEAWLDAGRDGDRSTSISGMLGHYVRKNDVLFGEARFYPGPMDWNVYIGWEHRFGKEYFLGYKYDLVDKSGHIIGKKNFGERWGIRYDRDLAERENEFGLSYRIHNYMTLEYVYNDEDGRWLRLIANL